MARTTGQDVYRRLYFRHDCKLLGLLLVEWW